LKDNKNLKMEKREVSLKQLVRWLHVSEPKYTVMCLLGKVYPKTEKDFLLSGIQGRFEADKAGKKMKFPVLENWESYVVAKGNVCGTWENLIEHKKLPYFDLIRNIRNFIFCGIRKKYHEDVLKIVLDKDMILKKRILPYHFLSIYQYIPRTYEEFSNIKSGKYDKENMPLELVLKILAAMDQSLQDVFDNLRDSFHRFQRTKIFVKWAQT